MLSMPMSGYPDMDVQKYLGALRARRWLIAGIVGTAMIFALLASLAQSSRYQARAELLFGRTAAADAIVAGGTAAGTEVPESTVATNLALASLDTVAHLVKERLGWRATADELKSAVQIAPRGDSALMTVTAEWSSPTLAADLANAFATEIAALRREVAQADVQRGIDALKATLAQQPTPTPIPGAPDGTPAPAEAAATSALRDRISELELLKSIETGGVSVVERATPPQGPSAPRPLRNAVIAGLLALVLAILVVVVLARFDERIADEDQLAELVGAPILARIPQLPRSRSIASSSAADQDRTFVEAFEFLRLNLELQRADALGRGAGGSVVVAITSAGADEGKTTIVSWLTRAIGTSGGEVVAVDLDVRKPELHRYLSSFGWGNGAPTVEGDGAGDDAEVARQPAHAHARRVYAEDDITTSLTELVLSRGNARRAAQSLKSVGLDISESTLRRWKDIHAPLYHEIEAAHAPEAPARYVTHAMLLPGVRLFTAADDRALAEKPSAREQLRELFAELRLHSDYVLVDTVPVGTVADASAVAAEADGVILVVDLARMRRRDLLATKRQLENARAEVIGIVLNRSQVEHSAYGAPTNGAGSRARQLADSSRERLRRVRRPERTPDADSSSSERTPDADSSSSERTPDADSSSWLASFVRQRERPRD
jgi:capsular polysaccharide biosynthesis protein/Mrp family chromosome partitioning ATPase